MRQVLIHALVACCGSHKCACQACDVCKDKAGLLPRPHDSNW